MDWSSISSNVGTKSVCRGDEGAELSIQHSICLRTPNQSHKVLTDQMRQNEVAGTKGRHEQSLLSGLASSKEKGAKFGPPGGAWSRRVELLLEAVEAARAFCQEASQMPQWPPGSDPGHRLWLSLGDCQNLSSDTERAASKAADFKRNISAGVAGS